MISVLFTPEEAVPIRERERERRQDIHTSYLRVGNTEHCEHGSISRGITKKAEQLYYQQDCSIYKRGQLGQA